MAKRWTKLDPSRTKTQRLRFMREVYKRFRALKVAIYQLIVTEDAFGLEHKRPFLGQQFLNAQYAFLTDPAKAQAFQDWLRTQIDAGILRAPGALPGKPWTAEYIESAWRQGMLRAYTDVRKEGLGKSPDWYTGSKEQFLRSAFGQPEMASKVALLAMRSFEGMKGVTEQMSTQLSRALADGMVNGWGPQKIARQMMKTIDSLTRTRALTIARTEVIHAHAEGQLDGYKALGVEAVDAQVEWSTAADTLVCPQCQPLEGKVFTVEEAHGMIPLHPNCRCAWKPAGIKDRVPPPPVNALRSTGIGPEAMVRGVNGMKNLTSYDVVQENIGGSTGAKLVDVEGIRYVMKAYAKSRNPTLQAQSEFIANRLLRAAKQDVYEGSSVPSSYLGKTDEGVAVFNSYVKGLQKIGPENMSLATAQAQEDFVTHAWLANWDVAGLSMDNVMMTPASRLVYLDNGGALLFRAQGGLKGNLFGSVVGELDSLRNASINPSSAKLFGNITDKKMLGLLDDFLNPAKSERLMKAMGDIIDASGMEAHEASKLKEVLIARYYDIKKYRDKLFKKLEEEALRKTAVTRLPAMPKGPRKVLSGPMKQVELEASKTMLTGPGTKAVRAYTGSSYQTWNKYAVHDELTAPMKSLDTALKKLPGYRGITFRSLRNYDVRGLHWSNWTSGRWAEVRWKAYSSSTMHPTSTWSTNEGILFIIRNKGKQGSVVGLKSTHPLEHEVLYGRGSRFRVQGFWEAKAGEELRMGGEKHRKILILEEVEDIPESQGMPHQYTRQELVDFIKAEKPPDTIWEGK